MYIPIAFAESDQCQLHDWIEAYSFGLLVTQKNGSPFATHLPFLLDRQQGTHGCLIGHMARANPQWRDLRGQTVLAIFSGPHAYISPSWYEASDVVPTWNYVAVHVYGPLETIEEPDAVFEIVEKSVHIYEQSMPRPWKLGERTEAINRMLEAIVGFRIPIERIEGKKKLNQNHPVERREKVIRATTKRW